MIRSPLKRNVMAVFCCTICLKVLGLVGEFAVYKKLESLDCHRKPMWEVREL